MARRKEPDLEPLKTENSLILAPKCQTFVAKQLFRISSIPDVQVLGLEEVNLYSLLDLQRLQFPCMACTLSQTPWDFPQLRVPFWGPYNKDNSILGSVSGSPYCRNSPFLLSAYAFAPCQVPRREANLQMYALFIVTEPF